MVKTHVLSTKLMLSLHGHGPILPPWADVQKVMQSAVRRKRHMVSGEWHEPCAGSQPHAEWAWIHWPHALGYPAGSAGYNESSHGFSKENPRSQKGKYGVLPLQLLIAQDNCIARMHLRRRDPESFFSFYLELKLGFAFSIWIQLVMSFK